ncbi:aminotransferase class I/II-fold pyridoxal phosphate-dependent enzyme, partial [candidate division KSB1 bacterium]|nr:aminotransferase class I/II-fold pyridoxal phosphate-dependent enzyme [candidate division KSB1 bacterium]
MDALNNIKESIRELAGYASPPQQEVRAKLNQNESPFDVPISVKRELAHAMVDLHWNRYPRYMPFELREKLSRWISIEPERILLGNGSNQLYQTFVSAVLRPGDKVLYSPPTFSLYEIFARVCEADLVAVPMTEDFDFSYDDFLSA